MPTRSTSALPPLHATFDALPLMHPTLVDALPAGPGWLFELKWDGVRVLALRRAGVVRLHARSGADVTRRYPEVTAAVGALPGGDLALDGEIVVLQPDGRSSFERLAHRMHVTADRAVAAAAAQHPAAAIFFDALGLDGRDLRALPLRRRVARLARVLPARGTIRWGDHVAGQGQAFLDAVCAAGGEGVVAKRADAPYRGGRRAEWLKVKCVRTAEFVIGGWTAPQGSRAHLGAVHLGYFADDGALVYAGRAGSGLDDRTLTALAARLAPLAVPRCPFARGEPPAGREHHWVRPELVCAVRFTEWTSDGRARHPVFLALRPARRAADVRRPPG